LTICSVRFFCFYHSIPALPPDAFHFATFGITFHFVPKGSTTNHPRWLQYQACINNAAAMHRIGTPIAAVMLSALTALVAEYRTPATNALTADWIFSSNFTPNPSNGGVKGGFAPSWLQ
jgi:hypothetical protein